MTTNRSLRTRRLALLLLLAVPLAAAPAAAQEDPDPRRTFERVYIDAAEYRGRAVLVQDWPALARLVRWSRALEVAVAEEEATIPAELLVEFRARVDSLEESVPPVFLTARGDSIRATIEAIRADLDRAETAVAARPPEAVPTGEEGANVPERRRTLVTGRTAVTVPAGVAVGEADSLPEAEVVEGEETFVDILTSALSGVDRIVHLVRASGQATPDASPARSSPRTTPPPGTP